jgi:CubicO group peptidase (beta-lactamase class C family)
MRVVLAPGAFLLLAVTSCAPSSEPPAAPVHRPLVAPPVTGDPLGDGIDAYVRGFGHNWGDAFAFSGYVAVAREGKLVFGKGYGQVDRNWGIVAGPDTRFRIGSTSKPFTAIGILQLEEKGLLRLEDPVRKYLPELPPMADGVTLHHCLTHTSGLPPLPDDEALVAETGRPHPLASAFASYKDRRLMFPPGERFEYANAGFIVLAAILERVSGQSYEAYMQEHVFGPAGMARTTTVSRPSPPPGTAVGYDLDPRGNLSVAKDPWYVLFGCGAILSTANDLVAFDRALSGTLLLGEASKRRMFTPERDVGGIVNTPSRYGLGWLVSEDAGHPVFWHPGGIHGFETSFARVPDAKLTVVVLSNRFDDEDLVGKIAQAVQDAALTGRTPVPAEEPAALTLDASTVTSLAGDYGVDAPSRASLMARYTPDVVEPWSGLSLTDEDGHLFLAIGEPGPEIFRRTDGGLFGKQDDLRLAVERDAAGRTRAVVLTRAHPGSIPLRYARLGTTIDPLPEGSCPPGMARLPGGKLTGEHGGLVDAFCMDITEVTVGAYSDCARSGRCPPAPTTAKFEGITDELRAKWNPTCNGARRDRLDHPVNCVDWAQSATYCRAQGKRLPTEQEWEWAARGGEQAREYPWGYRAPASQLCWSGVQKRTSTCPVGSFAAGDAPGAIHDLAGNVGEWTSTSTTEGHVVKAAGWNTDVPAQAEGVTREVGIPIFRGPATGFRCVR